MDDTAEFRIYLLGPPHVEHRGVQLRVDTRKAIALLAWLAVERRSHARATLAALLWPESDEQHARGALRRTIHSLTRILPHDALVSSQDRIELVDSPDLFIDVFRFRNTYQECAGKDPPCGDCGDRLAEAFALYRDTFLAGFSIKGAVEFDDWHFFQAESLKRQYVALTRAYIDCLRRSGDLYRALEAALQWANLDTLEEEPQIALMELLALRGERASALRRYDTFRAQLERELDEEPSPKLDSLYDEIKAGRFPPASPSPERAGEARSAPVQAFADRHPATMLAVRLAGETQGDQTAGRYMSLLYALVPRYGGRIESHSGRTVLIAFGRSATRENAPELAVRASLDARGAARRMRYAVAAGVSSGTIDVAADSPATEAHTVRGPAVNEAIRLAAAASEGEIMVSEATYRSTRRAVRYTRRDRAARLGRVWLAESLQPVSAKSRGIEGLRTSLVGRDEEMRRVALAIESVRDGNPRIVTVTGAAGVGKSRLITEAMQRSTGDGGTPVVVLKGRCLDVSVTVGYWPFLDMLRQQLSLTPEMGLEQQQAELACHLDFLRDHGAISEEQHADIARGLSHLISSPTDDGSESGGAEDPYAVRNAIFRAMRLYLLALAQLRPLVVVFEDLHWADTLSIDLISFILEALHRETGGRLAFGMICSYRPDAGHRCRHLPDTARRKCPEEFIEISLRELEGPDSIRLTRGLLGDLPIPGKIEDFLVERAQGNPFFIEEVVRSLLDLGLLVRNHDRWEATGDAPAILVPRSVESVIRAGTDRLSGEVQRVLRSASVIGRVFDEATLKRVAGDDPDFDRALLQLEDLGLVFAERTVPRREYSFRHVLTREAVYTGIPEPQKKALHRRVAEELERSAGDYAAPYLEQIAHHFELAGLEEKAIRYLVESGRKAIRESHNDAAIALLERALRLLKRRPPGDERDRIELEALVSLGVPVTATTGYGSPKAIEVYERANELIKKDDRSPLAFAALFGLFRYTMVRSEIRVGIGLAERLVDHASHIDDRAIQLEARRALGTVLVHAGELTESDRVLREGLALYDPSRHRANAFLYGHDPATTFYTYIALELWLRGLADQALRTQEELLGMLDEVAHPLSIAYSLSVGVIVFMFAGRAEQVMELTSRALELAGEGRLPMFGAIGRTLRGWAIARTSSRTEGIEEMRRGLVESESAGSVSMRHGLRATLAELLLESEAVDEAERELGAAEDDLAGGELMLAPEVDRVRAQLAYRRGDLRRAGEALERATDLARSTGALSLELRAAITSVQLEGLLDRTASYERLRATCERFTEGFDTADLRTAAALLAGIESRT